jgi:hypothetical protein
MEREFDEAPPRGIVGAVGPVPVPIYPDVLLAPAQNLPHN